MYKLKAVMATPEFAGDDDIVYVVELEDKKALHKVEAALIRGLQKLSKLTEEELETGKKALAGGNPQLVIFSVDISKGAADFGGYSFRWPNQTDVAREFLKGMLDGLMKETGHAEARSLRRKGNGRR